MGYWSNLFWMFSCLLNVLLGGNPFESLSARIGLRFKHSKWLPEHFHASADWVLYFRVIKKRYKL